MKEASHPSRSTGDPSSDWFGGASVVQGGLAFALGLIVALYFWFPGPSLERWVRDEVESRLPDGVVLETFDYDPPFRLEVTPVAAVGDHRVSLPLSLRPRVTFWNLGVGFRGHPGTSLSGVLWLRGRRLEVTAEKFRITRLLPVDGRVTGQLEVTLARPSSGRFDVRATFPDLVLVQTIPGVQERLTLERLEGNGRLEDGRIRVDGLTLRGEELRAEADVRIDLATPPRASTVRLTVRLEKPSRRRFEQTSTAGQLLELLGAR